MAVKVIGTGSALPEKIVTNDDLAMIMDTSDEWIKERTGISKRRLSTGETVADLATAACEKALEKAGKTAEEVELMIVATCTPEQLLPCVACQIQDRIAAKNAVAFDLNAACGGFLFALNTAYAYMSAGIYKTAVVVGAEVLSKIMDWEDRSTCVLFGDGAGAVVLEKREGIDGILGFVQQSDGAKGHVLSCGSRAVNNPYCKQEPLYPYVIMDGREVFQFAVRQVPACINQVLENLDMTIEDVDLFLLHQANARIIETIARRYKLPIDKFPMNISEYGNMSSACIPVLMDQLNREGELKEGMKLVLSGFGAGLTFGACAMIW